MTKTSRWLAFAGAMIFASVAQANWIEKSDVNAMLVLEASAEFSPEGVANQGLDKFDGEIMDLNPDVFQRSQDSDRALLKDMQKRLAKEQHPKIRQDLEILIQALEDGLESGEVNRSHLLPYY
ncbi:MAG: hypothetical protein IMF06_05315, partial [Proteobacteria bacterium]|nr:hypothetical protein [Pseudomonadota bacterium]